MKFRKNVFRIFLKCKILQFFFSKSFFFKVHLKIQEIRFLRFPDRCGGPEKSYEPSKTRKYTKIMIFGRNRVWVPFEKYSETGTQKSSSEKNVTKKKLFWKTFFFWRTDRIIYFSTHPGTLKTVHGNPLNFSSKTTCSQGGGGPPKFPQKKVATFKSRLI